MPSQTTAVHQLVTALSWSDAVGNFALELQRLLRSWGYESTIFAGRMDQQSRSLAVAADKLQKVADRRSVLLIHHSFESRLVPLVRHLPGRKAVVYHNITPAHFFEGFDSGVAAACAAGRDELRELASMCERAYALSRFSAEELSAARFSNVSVLPFSLIREGFDVAPDPALLSRFDDGCFNVLFVGRAVPNKRLEDVLRVFAAFQRLYNPKSRLIVAGEFRLESAYVAWLKALRGGLRTTRTHFLGRLQASQLSACYQVSQAYLSMSQHEGVGFPLLEAMHRGISVVAYGAAAVPETLGGAGVVTRTRDPIEVAKVLAVLDRHPELRARIISRQKRRVARFAPNVAAEPLWHALAPLLGGASPQPAVRESSREVVLIVCPSFDLEPDSSLTRAARALGNELSAAGLHAPILALKACGWPEGTGPDVRKDGAVEVRSFSPELPMSSDVPAGERGILPSSSSLETAVLVSSAPVVLFGADEAVCRHLIPRLGSRGSIANGSTSVDRIVSELKPGASKEARRLHAS